YDSWGRLLATWSPLDREDRPGLKFEYRDAVCVAKTTIEPYSQTLSSCGDSEYTGLRDFVSPTVVKTLAWNDQVRGCKDQAGVIVDCLSSSALNSIQSDGGYLTSYAFGDGQLHLPSVNRG